MTKRIFIAALGTETNQFVPFPTGRRAYEEHGVWRGDATQARADQLHRAPPCLAQGSRSARLDGDRGAGDLRRALGHHGAAGL